VASIVLVLVHVPQHTTVSPIDEYVYIDYLAKVPTQLVVHQGEDTGEYARKYLACNGVRTVGTYPDSLCERPSGSGEALLPNAGATSADLYTPVYFAATWVMAQPLLLLGVDDLTEAGRYTGWTWLAAAAILLYLTLRRWKVPLPVAAGSSLLMVGSLSAYWSNTYISTDAPSLFAGALMLFGITLVAKPGRRGVVLFVLFAVVASVLKLQNLMAVGLAALVLLVLAGFDAFRSGSVWREKLLQFVRDRRTLAAGLAVVCGIVVQGIWVVIRSAIAVGELPDQGVSRPFGKTDLMREAFKFFPGVSAGALSPEALGLTAVIASSLMTAVVLVGVLGLLAVSDRRSLGEGLAASSLLVALLSGPALAIANIAVSGFYFDLPARYGVSLLPSFLACAAVLFSRKAWVSYLIPVIAVVSYVAVLMIHE
jgi:hypothetical protein